MISLSACLSWFGLKYNRNDDSEHSLSHSHDQSKASHFTMKKYVFGKSFVGNICLSLFSVAYNRVPGTG